MSGTPIGAMRRELHGTGLRLIEEDAVAVGNQAILRVFEMIEAVGKRGRVGAAR